MSAYHPVDSVDPRRRRNMAAIRSKNTKPERLIRSALFRRGFRYRLHDRSLPGRPDLVFKRRQAVVLVHGCFWHRHKGCFTPPKTRPEFWDTKLRANVARDQLQLGRLRALGWRVAIVWECATRRSPEEVALRLEDFLLGAEPFVEISA